MTLSKICGVALVGAAAALAFAAPATATQPATHSAKTCTERTYTCGFDTGYLQGRRDATRHCGPSPELGRSDRTDTYPQGYTDGYDTGFRSYCR
ncbi:hypothetical protein [Cryptosporangium phraense]|uniref:Uncharacterized protein n=1 Tax=Cryptosporangium phraense TaxID=2593070 RepID=A0A545AY79_9ACTN|nr:hypothetical protein [Cryptosporangium phraense]TQS46292.1 hypothetical protein FL583_02545 [Cryptosporangium phraense]